MIKAFKIEKLFGYQNVEITFKENIKILIGENGLGKTTVLNSLYYLLTKKLSKLALVEFEKIGLELINGFSLSLTKEDIIFYNNEQHTLNRGQAGIKNRVREIIDISELSKRINLDNLTKSAEEQQTIREYISEKSKGRHIGPTYVITRYVYEILSEKEILVIHEKFENLYKELAPYEILYFPTYRRVEEELKNLGKLKKIGTDETLMFDPDDFDEEEETIEIEEGALIHFGMEDVEKRIESIKATIKESSIHGFSKVTGEMLSQLLKGFPDVSDDFVKGLDFKTIQIVLRRVGDNLPKDDRHEILRLINSDSSELLKKTELVYFLSKLVSIYEQQREVDDSIKKFKDVCNNYLSGKEFKYDESTVDLRIFRTKSDQHVNLNKLSSGEKQIVSLFSKIYLESKENYIVLFDEPELSLSIKWQKQLLPDIFNSQKCKFLLAVTHSPFVFKNEMENYAIGMNVYVD